MFFMISGLILINNYGFDISEKEEFKSFSKMYSNWMGQIYSNLFEVTGQIVKINWFPK